MKKSMILILLVSIIQSGLISQSCLPDGITFSTQAEIDSFQTNYPNCSVIEGDVLINGVTDITNLLGLSVIEAIEGDFDISLNFFLNNLSGLDSLKYVGGYFQIWNNSTLSSLNNLSSLHYVGGLVIISNESLVDITGLNNLDSIAADLHIEDNEILSSLTGLENITSIGEDLQVGSYYGGNTLLENISGLDNLISIEGDLLIAGNHSLTSINELNNLVSIEGKLWINNNDSLVNLDGLNNMSSMGELLWITDNYSLSTLAALDSISPGLIIDLWISGNSSLTTCEIQSVCDFLATPNANIYIENNASGCNNVEEVEYACTVWVTETCPHSTFTIYPNPTENELFFSSKDGITIREVMIYDQLGQKVLHRKVKNNNIDISSLEQGLYIIEFTTDKIKSRQKLIIR